MPFFKKNKSNESETLSAEALSEVNGGATARVLTTFNAATALTRSFATTGRLDRVLTQVAPLRAVDLTRFDIGGRLEGLVAH